MKDSRRQILFFVLALGFFQGVVYNFLPVTFPVFTRQFHVSLEQLGRVPLVFFLSSIVFSASGGWLITRMGTRLAGISTLGLLAAGFATIAAATSYAALLTGACLFGLAVVGMEVLSAAIISDLLAEQRQSNFFLWAAANSVGSAIGPTLIGAFIKESLTVSWSWRAAYCLSGIVSLAFLLWPVVLRRHWSHHHDDQHAALSSTSQLLDVLRRPAIYALGIATFLHGVAQIGMVSWIGQVYLQRFAIDPQQAALFISVNSAGFFAGRSLMTWMTRRWKIPELTLLACCAGVGSLAYIGTLSATGYSWGLLMFGLAGISISGNGPCINSSTGHHFPKNTATAFAVMNGFGNVGSAAGAYFVGMLGSRLGLERGIWYLPGFGLGLAAFALLWQLLESRRAARAIESENVLEAVSQAPVRDREGAR